jgi:hypothetical protein
MAAVLGWPQGRFEERMNTVNGVQLDRGDIDPANFQLL